MLLCCAVLCCAVLCCAVLCCAVPRDNMHVCSFHDRVCCHQSATMLVFPSVQLADIMCCAWAQPSNVLHLACSTDQQYMLLQLLEVRDNTGPTREQKVPGDVVSHQVAPFDCWCSRSSQSAISQSVRLRMEVATPSSELPFHQVLLQRA